jgi:hypothetical protein
VSKHSTLEKIKLFAKRLVFLNILEIFFKFLEKMLQEPIYNESVASELNFGVEQVSVVLELIAE